MRTSKADRCLDCHLPQLVKHLKRSAVSETNPRDIIYLFRYVISQLEYLVTKQIFEKKTNIYLIVIKWMTIFLFICNGISSGEVIR